MKKVHILLIVLLGFFLMPTFTFACENNLSKNNPSKETSSKMDKYDCCKKDSHSKNKNHERCSDKCNCASSCSNSFSITGLNLNNTILNFLYQKQNFYNYETSISSGFNSLWLIPKIG